MNEDAKAGVAGNVLGKAAELGNECRTHVDRKIANGQLETGCLGDHEQRKVLEEVAEEWLMPGVAWLKDMIRKGRLLIVDDAPA